MAKQFFYVSLGILALVITCQFGVPTVHLAMLGIEEVAAETYLGIGPRTTLGEIDTMFPRAGFDRVYPAWAQPSDWICKMEGEGLVGSIVLFFTDHRPEWKASLERARSLGDSTAVQIYASAADMPDEELEVNYIRWIPDTVVPLARLVAKYGQPDLGGFSDTDFTPYRKWTDRGLRAGLSDDEQNVVSVDFWFTESEYDEEREDRYRSLDEHQVGRVLTTADTIAVLRAVEGMPDPSHPDSIGSDGRLPTPRRRVHPPEAPAP